MIQLGWHEALGYAAAALTTIAFLPQAVKVIRSRHTADLSLPMYALFTAGVFFWLLYGFATGHAPIIAANAATLLLALTILIMKLRYG